MIKNFAAAAIMLAFSRLTLLVLVQDGHQGCKIVPSNPKMYPYRDLA